MSELKFANVAEVGDKIKAYDFEPMSDRGECYVIGRVIAKGRVPQGYDAYTIEILEEIWDGQEFTKQIGDTLYVPYQVGMTEWDGRVSKVQ